MPKQVPVPIPLDRWLNDIKRVEELRKVLDTEAFQTAVAILKEIAGPTSSTVGDDIHANNNRFAWYAGYRDAFNDLQKLTKLRDNKPVYQPDEWTHIQTPQ